MSTYGRGRKYAQPHGTVTPYTLHPTPYTLHPTPYTLHPTPYTPHPTPSTLHPAPYTLHPTPYTLHPTPYTQRRGLDQQGYLAYKKPPPRRTLQQDYAEGPIEALGGGFL